MSEKETPESLEEQGQEEVVEANKGLEASEEKVIEEASPEDEEKAQETAPEVPVEKKGLMERRPSFAQSSVPNAHKGYSTNPPVVMLLIVAVFVLISIIFATAAVVN